MNYIPGTLIRRRDGYIFIKTTHGLMAEHRWVAVNKMVHRKLREGEVVIRLKPKRDLNTPANLVVVQHSLTKFQLLPKSEVIYVPKRAKEMP